jgi:hypothetical protein
MVSSLIALFYKTYWQNQVALFIGTLRGVVRTRSRAASRRADGRCSDNFIRLGLFLINAPCTSGMEFA